MVWASFHKAKGPGSIPSQGTCLGCELSPQWGCVQRQLIDVSPSLLLSLKINKYGILKIIIILPVSFLLLSFNMAARKFKISCVAHICGSCFISAGQSWGRMSVLEGAWRLSSPITAFSTGRSDLGRDRALPEVTQGRGQGSEDWNSASWTANVRH